MGQTSVAFRISAPLYRLSGAVIPTDTPDGRYWTAFRIVELPGAGTTAAFQAGGQNQLTLPFDPDGGLHNTLVTVTSPHVHLVDRLPGQPLPQAQVVAVRVLNRLIDHYRVLADMPFIRRVSVRRASWMRYEVRDDAGQILRSGTNIVPTGLPPDGTLANVEPGDAHLEQTLHELSWYSQPTYRTLYMDARAELEAAASDPSAIASALAHLFMSFEMLAWLAHAAKGRASVGDARYETEFAVNESGDPIAIRKVILQLHEWAPSHFPSKSRMRQSLDELLRHRNDVMHGRGRDYPLPDVVEAFTRYDEFETWLDEVLSDSGGPAAAGRSGP